ncbi:MAG: tetratricopeptide repeat protein, partial [Acidobacteriota bacterium]
AASRSQAKAGDLNGAIALLQAAVQAAETKATKRAELTQAWDQLGKFPWMGNRKVEARALLSKSVAAKEAAFGLNAPEVADTLDEMSNAFTLPDEHLAMLPVLSRSRQIRESAFGASSFRVAPSVVLLATYYRALGDAKAEELYRQAIALCEPTHFEPQGPGLSALVGLAQFLQEQGRGLEAEIVRDRFNAEVDRSAKLGLQ